MVARHQRHAETDHVEERQPPVIAVETRHLADRPGVRQERRRQDAHEERDLIREELHQRPPRPDHRIDRPGIPPAQEKRHRRDRQQVEDDDHVPAEREKRLPPPDGHVKRGRHHRRQRHRRREHEHAPVHALRDEVLLGRQLDEVRQRLVPGGSHAVLQLRAELPVHPLRRQREDHQEEEPRKDQHVEQVADHPLSFPARNVSLRREKSTPRRRYHSML